MVSNEVNYETEFSSKNFLIQRGVTAQILVYGEPLKYSQYLWEIFPSRLGEPINLIKKAEVSFPVVSGYFLSFSEVLIHIDSLLTDCIVIDIYIYCIYIHTTIYRVYTICYICLYMYIYICYMYVYIHNYICIHILYITVYNNYIANMIH